MPKNGRQLKWQEAHVLTIYELAKQGLPDTRIAGALGVQRETFSKWVSKRPQVAEALRRGRELRANSERAVKTFQDYVYGRLPYKLQKLYKRIMDMDKEPNSLKRIERLLSKHGLRIRQQLWVHAFVSSNFNKTAACRFVNVPPKVLEMWVKRDPDFRDLVDSFSDAKGDFFESKFMELVDRGDTNAVLFAMRTYNRDRGYSDKQVVEHTGTVTHTHTPIDQLNLPLDTRLEILRAMREARMSEDEGGRPLALPESPKKGSGK